jgi:hypothetical protein
MDLDKDEDGETQDQEEATIRDQGLEHEELSQEVDAFIGELRLDIDRYTSQMKSISLNMAGTIIRDGVEEKDQ